MNILKVMLFPLLMSTFSVAHATNAVDSTDNIALPKWLIVELIERQCSLPEPNPRVSAELEYDCSEKYQDSDGEEQSMNYSMRLIPLFRDDFNKDGIEDIVVEVESIGPLGGSVYSNSAIYYLLLNSNRSIMAEYEVLLYAPFSEHVVEYQLADKQLYYSAIPNFRSHPEAYNEGELIEPSIEFKIDWSDGVPVSSYYKDNCRLANNKNKKIFTAASSVERSKQIDIHDYTQIIEEKVQLNDLLVSSEMNGCNERKVSFYIAPRAGKTLPVLREVIQSLLKQTYYNKQLSELLKLDKQSQLVFGEVMTLDDNWSGLIHINRDNNESSMQINLYQEE